MSIWNTLTWFNSTMRYSIMLQVVGIITLILLGSGSLFAWLQNRPTQRSAEDTVQANREVSQKL